MGDMNAPLLPPRRRHQSPAENPAVGAVLLLEKAAALATALPPASAMPHWPWVCEAGAVPQFGREQAAAAMAADPFKASYVAEMDAELLKHTAGKPRKMRAFYRCVLFRTNQARAAKPLAIPPGWRLTVGGLPPICPAPIC